MYTCTGRIISGTSSSWDLHPPLLNRLGAVTNPVRRLATTAIVSLEGVGGSVRVLERVTGEHVWEVQRLAPAAPTGSRGSSSSRGSEARSSLCRPAQIAARAPASAPRPPAPPAPARRARAPPLQHGQNFCPSFYRGLLLSGKRLGWPAAPRRATLRHAAPRHAPPRPGLVPRLVSGRRYWSRK